MKFMSKKIQKLNKPHAKTALQPVSNISQANKIH